MHPAKSNHKKAGVANTKKDFKTKNVIRDKKDIL